MLKGKSARFWIFWNCTFSQLTMLPGTEIVLQDSGNTEEGWFTRVHCYMFDGDNVELTTSHRERDCDGFYEVFSEAACDVDSLRNAPVNEYIKAEYPYVEGLPTWDEPKVDVRDHSAEKAGY